MRARPGRRPLGVCFVTDRALSPSRPLEEVARAAIAGGADMVQLREKDLGGRALHDLARALVAAARGSACRVVVNDRLDVALAAGAGGVHLPGAGIPIGAARRHAGRKLLVGRSVHSVAEARAAAREGADYLFVGPVFATPSKAGFGPPLGPAVLAEAVRAAGIPVWAIGGIDAANAALLAGSGIAGVAVIRAVAAAPDPAGAVAALRAALGRS